MEEGILGDEYFMRAALAEAQKAYEEGEVPVGAVIVSEKQIIARAFNMTEKLKDVTAHAEMLAFTSASNYLGTKYLKNCYLYVTLEPCTMCAGASYWTQIDKIVIGASDQKRGFTKSGNHILHPKTKLITGILEGQSSKLLKKFFEERRK